MTVLTARQQQVLDAIVSHQEAHGYAPSLRELATTMGVASTNAVREWLVGLERKGAIAREPFKSRAIRVLAPVGARTRTVAVGPAR